MSTQKADIPDNKLSGEKEDLEEIEEFVTIKQT